MIIQIRSVSYVYLTLRKRLILIVYYKNLFILALHIIFLARETFKIGFICAQFINLLQTCLNLLVIRVDLLVQFTDFIIVFKPIDIGVFHDEKREHKENSDNQQILVGNHRFQFFQCDKTDFF